MGTRRLTWQETRRRLRDDRARLAAVLAASGREPILLATHPAAVCVVLYRLSHHFFHRGNPRLARLFWQLNLMLTGADISPRSDIGGGLVILNPVGAAISCDAGRNLTIMPLAGIGGEVGRSDDMGAGPGLPVLGDDVTLEPHAGVLGPVRIGDRVRVEACTSVVADVGPDQRACAAEPRFVRRRAGA
jgi:serine O-acetyltransferase